MTTADHPAVPDAAPVVSRRRSVFFLVGSLAGGNLVSMALGMMSGLLVGRLVLPATLGLFNGIGLILGYIPFLQLGILNGLNRELPYFIAKDDRPRAEQLAAAAQAWALTVGGVVLLALLGVAGWELAQGDLWKAAGWGSNAILALLLFYSTFYMQVTYRTSHDFTRLAMVQVVQSAFSLALLALVAVLNFYGLCIRAVLAGALGAALLYHWRPVRVRPKWDLGHLKHLLRIGAPIFGVGQVYAWWAVLDATLVLRLGGTREMGLYAMVLLAGAALQLLPGSVTQVLYPRMAEQYGRHHRLDVLLRTAKKPIALTATGLMPVVVAAWFAVGPITRAVVPKYADAIPAMHWALLVPLVGSFQPVNLVFNVVRRQGDYLAAILLGMAVYVGSLTWLIRDGFSLSAFPQAMLIGRIVFMITCLVLIRRLRNKERVRLAAGT